MAKPPDAHYCTHIERNSRRIIQRLEADGWRLSRVRGDHHVVGKDGSANRIVVPHPVKDLKYGTARAIHKAAGWRMQEQ